MEILTKVALDTNLEYRIMFDDLDDDVDSTDVELQNELIELYYKSLQKKHQNLSEVYRHLKYWQLRLTRPDLASLQSSMDKYVTTINNAYSEQDIVRYTVYRAVMDKLLYLKGNHRMLLIKTLEYEINGKAYKFDPRYISLELIEERLSNLNYNCGESVYCFLIEIGYTDLCEDSKVRFRTGQLVDALESYILGKTTVLESILQELEWKEPLCLKGKLPSDIVPSNRNLEEWINYLIKHMSHLSNVPNVSYPISNREIEDLDKSIEKLEKDIEAIELELSSYIS